MIGECVFHASQFEFTASVLDLRERPDRQGDDRHCVSQNTSLFVAFHPQASFLYLPSFPIHCPNAENCTCGEYLIDASECGLFEFFSDVYSSWYVFVIAGGSLQQKNFAYTAVLVDLLANIECKFLRGRGSERFISLFVYDFY